MATDLDEKASDRQLGQEHSVVESGLKMARKRRHQDRHHLRKHNVMPV